MQKLTECKLQMRTSCGYQTLFDKKGNYTGILFQEDIYAMIDEEDITEKEAEIILKKKAALDIKSYKEKQKEITKS